MKKHQLKKLQSIAANLPPIPQDKQCVRTGGEMREAGIKRINGKKVKKDDVYGGIVPGEVNHLERIKDLYKSGGDAAVVKYTGEVMKKRAELDQKIRKEEANKHNVKVI